MFTAHCDQRLPCIAWADTPFFWFSQMQNKGEMAQQLFDIIIGGNIDTLKNLHAPKKAGAAAKLRAAALAKIRTAPGPAPQRKERKGRRSPNNTPDFLPASHGPNPPTLNLRRSRAHGEEIMEEENSSSSAEEDTHSSEEEDQEEREPRQQPVFIRMAQQMAAQQAAVARASAAAAAASAAAAAMQMQPPARRYVQPMATRNPGPNIAVAGGPPSQEAPVLINADQDNGGEVALMEPPTVPSGVSQSNERGVDINMADPSLGCHALGLARRGSFEIVKLTDKARMAARFIPRNCSIQNLTMMEEAGKIESGTDWTDMAGVASLTSLGGGTTSSGDGRQAPGMGGMMPRNPSSLQLTELTGR